MEAEGSWESAEQAVHMEKADSQPQPWHAPESVDAEKGSTIKGWGPLKSKKTRPWKKRKEKTGEHQFWTTAAGNQDTQFTTNHTSVETSQSSSRGNTATLQPRPTQDQGSPLAPQGPEIVNISPEPKCYLGKKRQGLWTNQKIS